MKKIKVYVGCALTYAPEEYKKDIETFKGYLQKLPNVELLDFMDVEKGTSYDVYKHDIHTCVGKCDFFIAECSHPSTGLGWELGTAVEKLGIPVLAVARKDIRVTRLVRGSECDLNPNFKLKYYDSIDELVDLARQKIDSLLQKRT